MKKLSLIFMVFTGIIVGSTFNSTRLMAQEKGADKKSTQDDKKEEKTTIKDSDAVNQKATAEEWKAFKSETEGKITANETRIAELKDQKSKNSEKLDENYTKRVDALELKNKELKDRMNAYEKENSDWASFKREFNHDMDALGQAFKEILVDNKM